MANSPARKLADLLNDTQSAGQQIVTDGSGALSFEDSAGWSAWSSVDLTNGGADDLTDVDILTGLSDVSEIQFIMRDASLSSTDAFLWQIGDSGGYETTDYDSYGRNEAGGTGASQTRTDGFAFNGSGTLTANDDHTTLGELHHLGSNLWFFKHLAIKSNTGGVGYYGEGFKTLSGALTQLKITTELGSDTLDNGTIYARSR